MIKKWKDIDGYEGYYRISSSGNVIGVNRRVNTGRGDRTVIGKELKITVGKRGYKVVDLLKYGKRKNLKVHRMVATAFIPNPENKPQVNHKDGDKMNNNIENLEWVTSLENNLHAIKNGLINLRKKSISCSSKHIGVTWYAKNNKWGARIAINKKSYFLGLFEDEQEAAEAYQKTLSEIKSI